MSNQAKKDWFKDITVYQIYIRSFKDSNGDGIGDIPGIIEKLDYLEFLGIDMIWLNPFFSSPNDDNGYDISDYRSVMGEFGTMADIENLIAEADKRGISLMMDLVANHSSDEHPWFIEAKSNPDSPKRDYYIWRNKKTPELIPAGHGPGKQEAASKQEESTAEGGSGTEFLDFGFSKEYDDKELPNNWDSYFGGPAWTFHEETNQYYMHLFSKKQPDLNWESKTLRNEIHDIVRFWLDKGFKGIRFDAVHHIGKPSGLPDVVPEATDWRVRNIRNHDNVHKNLQELHKKVLSDYDIITVGETGGASFEDAKKYVNEDRKELDMIHRFDHYFLEDHNADTLSSYFKNWYKELSPKGWDGISFCNHDTRRLVSTFGDDVNFREESAKAWAVMLLSAWGTPFLYQGDELAMPNTWFPKVEDFRDLVTVRLCREALERGAQESEVLKDANRISRDNTRTPMLWNDSPYGGFSTNDPWIIANPQYKHINAEIQKNNPDSVLSHYRGLIALRKSEVSLRRGNCQFLESNKGTYSTLRQHEGSRIVTVINLSSGHSEVPSEVWSVLQKTNNTKLLYHSLAKLDLKTVRFDIPNESKIRLAQIAMEIGKSSSDSAPIQLGPWESFVIALS